MSDKVRTKIALDEDEGCDERRRSKAKRHEIELPDSADVDINLANKLDQILNVSSKQTPRFFTNKPRAAAENGSSGRTKIEPVNIVNGRLKARCLTREELRQRLIKKYDTLVPELDPKRPNVRVVQVLSATEAVELGKIQARKQLERQLELNSVSGNQNAHANGLKGFRFNDGYEMPMNNDRTDHKNTSIRTKIKDKLKIKSSSSKQNSKTVRFDDNVSHRTHDKRIEDQEEEADEKHDKSNRPTPSVDDEDDDDNYIEGEDASDDVEDDTTESDCSTTVAGD